MELQFKRLTRPCLRGLEETRNAELTQEIRLPDAMPDIGRILCAWGQTVLRGKEWRPDGVFFSGGMMVWVLYAPEDGSRERCMEGWIPFQMRFDLPEGSPEGTARFRCVPRFVDARNVSARKIMVRTGTAAQAEMFLPVELELKEPENPPEDVQLLKTRWPIQLPVEAGEKTFLLDEEQSLDGPETPQDIVCFRLDASVTEKRVLGSKLVFRGKGNLHILCGCTDGRLRSWDLELPFSQFAQLEGDYDDAQADAVLMPTSLELELTEGGGLRIKAALACQYLITDRQVLELTEDAYSPLRILQPQRTSLEVPAVLETRRELLRAEQALSGEAQSVADVCFLPDLPRQRRTEEGTQLVFPGQFQLLYYGNDGQLHSGTARWEGSLPVPADENTRLLAAPVGGELPKADISAGALSVRAALPVEITAVTCQQLPTVGKVELPEPQPRDTARPSLIVRRAGEERLWDIAKASGSTVEAICRINGLTEAPSPDRLLLIPIP